MTAAERSERTARRRSTVVDLVGAGPGDPDLLTLRAEQVLTAATLVVTDIPSIHLARTFAPDAALRTSPAGGPDRESINRGATVDGDTLAVLIGAARTGHRVVRLYRGDPWLHPAYAVESAILSSSGVEHRTVPGPLVELAVPTAAGIAVHHRPLASAVTIALSTGLPPAVDRSRTLVTVADDADDAGGVAARLARAGDPTIAAAVIVTVGGVPRAVRRGSLGHLARDRTLGGGVVVVGDVASESAVEAASALAATPDTAATGTGRGLPVAVDVTSEGATGGRSVPAGEAEVAQGGSDGRDVADGDLSQEGV